MLAHARQAGPSACAHYVVPANLLVAQESVRGGHLGPAVALAGMLAPGFCPSLSARSTARRFSRSLPISMVSSSCSAASRQLRRSAYKDLCVTGCFSASDPLVRLASRSMPSMLEGP